MWVGAGIALPRGALKASGSLTALFSPIPSSLRPAIAYRHVGGGGNAVDVDYGSMMFEVSQLDISLDIT